MVSDLTNTGKITVSLKILGLVLLLLTTIVPIIKVGYDATLIASTKAELTMTSLFETFEVISGDPNAIRASIITDRIILLFLIPLVLLGISIVVLLMGKTKISAVLHLVGLGFLSLYFLGIFVINRYNNIVQLGVNTTVSFDIGYYLIIGALVVFFLSTFIRFKKVSSGYT